MKTGAEVQFVAGQIFTLGVLAIAVIPRLPYDTFDGIGGKHSYNFRVALLVLVTLAACRTLFFHLRHISGWLVVLDNVLGTLHVAGQSFLCLSTAYVLQTQLANVINIGIPGRSLVPVLWMVLLLTFCGSMGSHLTGISKLWCLINLAEAISCWPVIQTLQQYASLSFVESSHRRHRSSSTVFQGPIIPQMLLVCEYWYLTTSILSFLAEAVDDNDNSTPLAVVSAAIRHNQDNGVDDWTRLLLHAVFQNSIDELQHANMSSSNGDPPGSETAEAMSSETGITLSRRRGGVV